MENLNNNEIRLIGEFLSIYHSDLTYIDKFHKNIISKDIDDQYLEDNVQGSFKNFLNKYKVSRCFRQGEVKNLYITTKEWLSGKNRDNVDLFAKELSEKDITHTDNEGNGKIMTSLASKILFLNNPVKILPYDGLAKNTIGYKGKPYNDYLIRLNQFRNENNIDKKVGKLLNIVEPFTNTIESNFNSYVKNNIETIRMNRLIDIMLWTGLI